MASCGLARGAEAQRHRGCGAARRKAPPPCRTARLLLLLAALRCACGYAGPFTASPRYSAGKVAPLRESPPLNASDAADLDEIATTRSYQGDLLFFQFESHRHRWLNFALNMASQLTAVGYHHYVALAGFAVDCERLHARWRELYADAGPGGAHPQPACAVAALPVHGTSENVEFRKCPGYLSRPGLRVLTARLCAPAIAPWFARADTAHLCRRLLGGPLRLPDVDGGAARERHAAGPGLRHPLRRVRRPGGAVHGQRHPCAAGRGRRPQRRLCVRARRAPGRRGALGAGADQAARGLVLRRARRHRQGARRHVGAG